MSKNSSNYSVLLSGLVCATIGHSYSVSRKITNHINEYKCSTCGREVTNNYTGKLEILTNKLKDVNSNVAAFFQKKTRRLSA